MLFILITECFGVLGKLLCFLCSGKLPHQPHPCPGPAGEAGRWGVVGCGCGAWHFFELHEELWRESLKGSKLGILVIRGYYNKDKFHRLGALNYRHLSSHSSGGEKSEFKVPTGQALLGLWILSSLCVLTWEERDLWCRFFFIWEYQFYRVRAHPCDCISPYWPPYRPCLEKQSHWGLGLQHMNLEGHNWVHNSGYPSSIQLMLPDDSLVLEQWELGFGFWFSL